MPDSASFRKEDMNSLPALIEESSLTKVPLLHQDGSPIVTNYHSNNSTPDDILIDVNLNNSDTNLPLEESFKNERPVVYCLFFLLGVSMLLPFNVFITSVEFFTYKFKGSKYESSFQNYFAFVSTTMQLLFLIYALATQQKNALYTRSLNSLVLMVCTFFVLLILAQISTFGSEMNFWLYLFLLAIGSASASIISSDALALAALINPAYVQSAIAGQAFAGLGISIFQISLTWNRGPISSTDPNLGNWILSIANWYFSVAFLATFASLVVYKCLDFNHQYKDENSYNVQLLGSADERFNRSELSLGSQISRQLKLCKSLYKELPTWSLNIFNIFMLTLAVFPAITASTRSTSSTGFVSNHFVAIHFIIFNLGDLIGRMLPANPKLTITDINTLTKLTWLRWLLVPIFLLGNLYFGESASPPVLPSWFASDYIFFLTMAVMSISNGYLASCILIVGPTKVVDQQSRGTMASLLVLMMIAGLSIGSFISFPLRAMTCLCNPF